MYTLFFYNNVVFQAQAEYSYFSADFRLKIFLYYSYIIAYDISVLEYLYKYVFGIWIRIALHCACDPPSARPICHVKQHLTVLALKKVFRKEMRDGNESTRFFSTMPRAIECNHLKL